MSEINESKLVDLPTPLPQKRKPDLEPLDDDRNPKKLDISEEKPKPLPIPEQNLQENNEEEEEEGEEEYEEEDDEEEEEEEGEGEGMETNGKVDKGKGIMKEEDNKGKGKLKVEDKKGKGKSMVEESSSEEDDEGNVGVDEDESDFSDDPLAEIDLDNILPVRTRRRAVQPGAYLVNDLVDNDNDDDDDEDEDA
ncbi:uncharacterized protein LOC143862274 [Tasmannia lanceolata]|uniref:uncharacterized protein LOC143862274 n=1 Tax=Tasmannia lanceolata TaxID=3420 RepID=UPI004063F618